MTQQMSRTMPAVAGLKYQDFSSSLSFGVSEYTRPLRSSFVLVRSVSSEITRVRVKQTRKAKVASQKFWAMVDGNTWRLPPSQPPLPSAVVKPCTSAEQPMPPNSPKKAPVPVQRAQNIPSRNVANNGAFTKLNTNWMISIALLYLLAKYAQPMLNKIPNT